MESEIPVVDLQGSRAAQVRTFGEAMTNPDLPGFAAFVGHDVSEQAIDMAYAASRALFAYDFDELMAYYAPELGGERGYTPPKETSRDEAGGHIQVEVKESISFGRRTGEHPGLEAPLRPVMPDALVTLFSDVMMRVFDPTHALFAYQIGLLEEYFGGSLGALEHVGPDDGTMMRFLMYPARARLERDAKRCAWLDARWPDWRDAAFLSGAHIDSSFLTNLIRATRPGLQFLDRQGRWVMIDISRLPRHAIVTNAGKCGGRQTGWLMAPRPHRVVRVGDDIDRLSGPCFGWLHPMAPSATAPVCLERGGRAFEPMPTWKVLQTDLRDYGML